ncbi:uncharacterized protein BO97DRAFT_403856 [Aspergillus homomorphus CBS 101889]|uniref:Uncharacterized protein n=1 Tax=Aspergillus homomorphus (strain CBS 101889) TaxID=1450537 RepID=A0A395I5J6_ASPHC|nr:hypothetical protein BO97DRAFT_403856 [Aspergillus homomorphus CBS 101889]RAL14803.1 hypothetical protein BO97DRAFT_403856 [Aspergillus homomorphus CBS 101889]
MTSQVSLMSYLQHGLPHLPVLDQAQSPPNTQNDHYREADITRVGHWTEFNLAAIQQQYGALLAAARIPDEPFQPSPPRPINSKRAVQSRINAYLTNRIIRALRCGFSYLKSTQQLANLTVVNYDAGTMAATIEDFTPDLAFFDPNLEIKTRPNRVPGDIEPSFKWSLDLRNHPDPTVRTEFKQALAQVNFYMNQHHARYGFILTDCELVAIRRLDRDGSLELADSIPWSARGSASQPRLTVLLGIWYLGMLAANDQDWSLD